MNFNRHDSLTTRIAPRGDRPYKRLWIEGNGFDRLGRNGFPGNARFDVRRRPGVGLILDESLMGRYKVTPRSTGSCLSYEARDLESFFGTNDVRVRISVKRILVLPLFRFQSIARVSTDIWTIKGATLTAPGFAADIRTAAPLNLPHSAGVIEVDLDETNLVFATEIIGNQRPGRVILRGTPVMIIVGGQFLRAGGYSETETPGEFAR